MTEEILDVLIVGAGLSGIGAAAYLQQRCPSKRYAIVERRAAMGGTWDLFRYPGIRSDSDMHTLGYAFKPWVHERSIANAPAILDYVRETAVERGIDKHIRYNRKVVRASWSSADALWTVSLALADGGTETLRSRFLSLCSGYYSYDEGHSPHFPEQEKFAGSIVHPQFWPEDMDYAGKRVVVIGSGATAVTLVPEMARTAAHVTMLQRSPTYVISAPAADGIANKLRRWLPAGMAYRLTRWKNVLRQQIFFQLARRRPDFVKKKLIDATAEAVGDRCDVGVHFTPRYNPWDQRLCLIPDGDLFAAINEGSASVVTDTIDRFTETGIVLASGETLAADIIVTATGLKLQLGAGAEILVDGEPVSLGRTLNYKGAMFSGIPNLSSTFGYTNASWTLKADLTSEYICRLINYMDANGYAIVTPVAADRDAIGEEPMLDFSSGYVKRAIDVLPKQGRIKPWRLNQNYFRDLVTLRHRPIADGTLRFSNPPAPEAIAAE